MSKRDIKGFLLVKLLKLWSFLPLELGRGLGAFIGHVAYWLGGRGKQVTQINLQHCFPEKSDEEIKRLTKAHLIEAGKTLVEMGPAWFWPEEKALKTIKTIHKIELMETAKNNKNGIIFLAPHLGNWEFLGVWLSANYPMTIMYAPAKLPALDRLIKSSRERAGGKLVPANRKGVVELSRALKRNESIGILPDQEPDISGGEFVSFFSMQALTITLASNLYKKNNAAVVLGYSKRVKGGFDLYFQEMDEAFFSEDIVTSVQGLSKSVERSVKNNLDQYQWEYKRFKKRPAGESKIY